MHDQVMDVGIAMVCGARLSLRLDQDRLLMFQWFYGFFGILRVRERSNEGLGLGLTVRTYSAVGLGLTVPRISALPFNR